jgi:hypothetical protein
VRGWPGWVWYAVLPLSVWLLWWLAFFPGVIEYDALDQWRQIAEGRYDDWHPAFHTWIIWLLTRPGGSFGSMSLVQVLVGAGLAARLLALARRLGSPPSLVWTADAWLALSPVFALNLLAVWKDTAFGLDLVWMTILLLRVVETGDVSGALGIQLGVSLALAWLIRHNGPAVALPVVGALAWYFRPRLPRGLAATVAVLIGIVVLVHGPFYREAGVRPPGPVLPQESLILEISALVHAGTPLTDDEAALLRQFLPLETWRSAYVCDRAARPLMRAGFRGTALAEHPFALLPIGLRLAARNPSALVRHWACATRFLWYPSSTLYIGYFADGITVLPNAQGVTAASLLPSARRWLAAIVTHTLDAATAWRTLVWQPAIPLYILVATLAVATWRARGAAPLIVWLPALCNTLVWLVLTHGSQLRFQWPVVLLAPLAVPLAGVSWRRRVGSRASMPSAASASAVGLAHSA